MDLHVADILTSAIMEGKFVYKANNQTCMNVLHWYPDANIIGVDEIAVTDAFLATISNNGAGDIVTLMADLQSSSVSWIKVTAQIIHIFRFIVREAEVAQVGLDVNPCTAQNIQACITKTGSAGTRSNIGAFHLGGLPQTNYQFGLITAGCKTKLQTLADKLELPITLAGGMGTWLPGILNKEPIPNTDPVKFRIKGITPLFEMRVKTTIRIMYRRTIGVGD